MDTEGLTNEELKKQIKERRKKICEIAKFIDVFTRTNGKVITHEINSSDTHIVREWDFFGFKFSASTGETMMGGNTYKAWYNNELLFSVRFMGDIGDFRDWELNTYDIHNPGFTEFDRAMADPEDLANKKVAEESKIQKAQNKAAEQAEERATLLKEAQKLKL